MQCYPGSFSKKSCFQGLLFLSLLRPTFASRLSQTMLCVRVTPNTSLGSALCPVGRSQPSQGQAGPSLSQMKAQHSEMLSLSN